MVASMSLTEDGDEMCCRQLKDVGDGFGHFAHQHQLSFCFGIEHQHSKDVTKIAILSKI